jgi:hypothetical protein
MGHATEKRWVGVIILVCMCGTPREKRWELSESCEYMGHATGKIVLCHIFDILVVPIFEKHLHSSIIFSIFIFDFVTHFVIHFYNIMIICPALIAIYSIYPIMILPRKVRARVCPLVLVCS